MRRRAAEKPGPEAIAAMAQDVADFGGEYDSQINRPAEPEPVPEPEAAPAERQPDFFHAGRPVFRCHRGCGDRFERVNDLATVIEHELSAHPTNLRESALVDADGRPLLYVQD